MTEDDAMRRDFCDRIRVVRIERYGDDEAGIAVLASLLEMPASTWENYESGVTMTAQVLLRLMALTRVNAHWLTTGGGAHYSRTDPAARFSSLN